MKRRFPPQLVFDRSLALTNCERSDIMGSGRHRTVVLAREAITGAMREVASPLPSWPEIAVYFGRNNHSSVRESYQRFEAWFPCLRRAWLDMVRDACEGTTNEIEPQLTFTPPWSVRGSGP